MVDRSLVVQAAASTSLTIAGRSLVSFAGFNYLGLNRRQEVQRAMNRAMRQYGMALAMPRSLAATDETLHLEGELAHLVGQERALTFPSTTHAALDVIPAVVGSRGLILIDEGAYAISEQAARQARAFGAEQIRFAHNDCASLQRQLRAQPRARRKLVVCDGVYSADGRSAPLKEFAALAAHYNAFVYVDDAHGLGILGSAPGADAPYGAGGGGIVLHQGVTSRRILYVSSLSKAFGVPLAFVAGSGPLVDFVQRVAGSIVHSSPPALPLVAAARAVLRLNALYGDDRRRRILANVRTFSSALHQHGIGAVTDTLYPLRTVRIVSGAATLRALHRNGLHAIVQCAGGARCEKSDYDGACVLRCVITADHTQEQLATLADVLSAYAHKTGDPATYQNERDISRFKGATLATTHGTA